MNRINMRTDPDDLLVSVRGDLGTEVVQHLTEEFDTVVHFLQGSVGLLNLLGPHLILDNTRKEDRRRDFLTTRFRFPKHTRKVILAWLHPSDHSLSSVVFFPSEEERSTRATNISSLRLECFHWNSTGMSLNKCCANYENKCTTRRLPVLTSFTMFLMSRLASCRSSGFLLLRSSANLYEKAEKSPTSQHQFERAKVRSVSWPVSHRKSGARAQHSTTLPLHALREQQLGAIHQPTALFRSGFAGTSQCPETFHSHIYITQYCRGKCMYTAEHYEWYALPYSSLRFQTQDSWAAGKVTV